MSRATFSKLLGLDWQADHRLSANGCGHVAVSRYIKEHKEITAVIISLDNDEAGQKATETIEFKLLKEFAERKISISRIISQRKDWKDFRPVLTAICSIKETDEVSIPMPKNNKWLGSGEIVGNNYSVAWRLLNAQYWGVAQRRRIYLGLSVSPSVAARHLPHRGETTQILEEKVPAKYYLSPKACLGIIKRSMKRGKGLPSVLLEALKKQAGLT